MTNNMNRRHRYLRHMNRIRHRHRRPTYSASSAEPLPGTSNLYCEENRLNIPKDLELVVVNEWPAHLLRQSSQMHRIVRRKREIGSVAAQLLLRLRAEEQYDSSIIRIPAELFEASQAPRSRL